MELKEQSINFETLKFDDEELERMYQERLSYPTVLKQVQTKPKNWKRYAQVLVLLDSSDGLSNFDKVVGSLRPKFDDAMNHPDLQLVSSDWGKDDSWIQWDVAKQLYFFLSTDRSDTNPHYRIANPLIDEQVREEIVSRQ